MTVIEMEKAAQASPSSHHPMCRLYSQELNVEGVSVRQDGLLIVCGWELPFNIEGKLLVEED